MINNANKAKHRDVFSLGLRLHKKYARVGGVEAEEKLGGSIDFPSSLTVR